MKQQNIHLLKLGLKFYTVFILLFLANVVLAFIMSAAGAGEQNISAWIFIWLMVPALVFQKLSAGLAGKIYISSFGIFTILGSLLFYFLLCLCMAWVYTRIKSRK